MKTTNVCKTKANETEVWLTSKITPSGQETDWAYERNSQLVERFYLRQRSSDGSVNKTILKTTARCSIAAQHQWDFPRHKIPCSITYKTSERDLENWVRGCSGSLKMAPFDRPYTTFYWSITVIIALYCTVFELFAVE